MLHPRGLPLTYSVCVVPQKLGLCQPYGIASYQNAIIEKNRSVLIESSMYHMYCETTRVHRDPLAIVKVTDWPMVEHSLD